MTILKEDPLAFFHSCSHQWFSTRSLENKEEEEKTTNISR